MPQTNTVAQPSAFIIERDREKDDKVGELYHLAFEIN